MKPRLRIGLTSCFFYPDPKRNFFSKKTLLYMEESMAKMVMYYGAIPILIPRVDYKISLDDFLSELDGVILQAGSDISPKAYKEEALKEEWKGDAIRDEYELAVLAKAMEKNKPVLGICRGFQLINVAFGGSLFQDIPTQFETKVEHRNGKLYDGLTHEIILEEGGRLTELYQSISMRTVMSVHHQGIKKLGENLGVEARSKEDGLIEAVRYLGKGEERVPYVFGVQWHPEFQVGEGQNAFLDRTPLLDDYFIAIKKVKELAL